MTSKIVERHIPCPSCTSSDAYCTYDDGHGWCYSCNYFKPAKDLDLNDYTYEYLPLRGINETTLRFYGVQTKVNPSGRPESVGFRYSSGGTKVRLLSDKTFRWEPSGVSKPGLFGVDLFASGSHRSVTITEGELDACSLYQVLRTPVVSVQSASSAVRDCSADFSFLSGFERVYLAFDSDAAGRAATSAVARLFDPGKVFHVRFTNRKDANEYLQLGEAADLLNIWHNAKPYVPDNIIFSFDDFKKALSKPHKEGVPYPFPTLNKMTYGLRTGEVVLLKAPEKVGKTSLMHEFLRNILRRTDDNVAAIFLEEPKHRLLQSLAGLEIGRPVHLPSSPSTECEILDAVKKLVKRDERLHIYDNFGATDPDVFLDLVRFLVAGRLCKFVLLDHISIGASVGPQGDERRVLEYLANRLEMLVKELDFSLLMVSHVNDFGQTRGSHYLTKVADITIDASRDTLSGDERQRRTICLSVPYNRFCSDTGPAGSVVFDPVTYRLTEEPANDDRRTTGLRDLPWQTPSYGRAA
jgi:twinkle protein